MVVVAVVHCPEVVAEVADHNRQKEEEVVVGEVDKSLLKAEAEVVVE